MYQCYSTGRFNNKIADLLKKAKDGYGSVRDDIAGCFSKTTYRQLLDSPEMVYDTQSFRIIKMRVLNSIQNLSRKNGYRLIYLIRKDREEVVLLYAYPKRGNKSQTTVSKTDINSFLTDYIGHQKAGTLRAFDLDD